MVSFVMLFPVLSAMSALLWRSMMARRPAEDAGLVSLGGEEVVYIASTSNDIRHVTRQYLALTMYIRV